MFLFKVALILIIFAFIYNKTTKKYISPYTLNLTFGKKGVGKSTLMTKLAIKAMADGRTVYCTEPLQGCIQIDPHKLGTFMPVPESLVLIDEINSIFDNRNFKHFESNCRDFFIFQRHYRCTVYAFAQTWDGCDKKIRDLADNLYLCTRFARVFAISRRVCKRFVLHQSTPEAPAGMAEDLYFDLPFMPGAIRLTFIPFWSKYFDSFAVPSLPDLLVDPIPVENSNIIKILERRKRHDQKRIKIHHFKALSFFKIHRFKK